MAVSRTKESLLVFSLCRYLTAVFLNSSVFGTSSVLVVQGTQTDLLHRLQHEVAQLDTSKQAKVEEVLMAVIMFGLSTNWDCSNTPSIFHYNAAVRIYRHVYQDSKSNARRSDHQDFFVQSLIYWWMGLCFVTDTRQDCLLEPPFGDLSAAGTRSESTQSDRRIPHPLTGVSPEAQKLLGDVGSLVHEQGCEKSFTSLSRLQEGHRALQEARRLEEEALSMDTPRTHNFLDLGDPDTPLEDLVRTAEVYRLSALILLYRTFPDLLNVRLRLAEDASSDSQQAEQRRLLWLTALATHALQIVCLSAPCSGTRSIESILLVIIAGELRKPPSSESAVLQPYHQDDTTNFNSLLEDTPPTLAVMMESVDQFAALRGFSQQVLIDLGFDGSLRDALGLDHVAEARMTILRRLQSIREILPYRSLEIVEEIVLTTWNMSDQEKSEVFWMDIMIEKGWKFLLI